MLLVKFWSCRFIMQLIKAFNTSFYYAIANSWGHLVFAMLTDSYMNTSALSFWFSWMWYSSVFCSAWSNCSNFYLPNFSLIYPSLLVYSLCSSKNRFSTTCRLILLSILDNLFKFISRLSCNWFSSLSFSLWRLRIRVPAFFSCSLSLVRCVLRSLLESYLDLVLIAENSSKSDLICLIFYLYWFRLRTLCTEL